MKYISAFLLFAASASVSIAAPVDFSPSQNISGTLFSSVASFVQLPAVKGRTGSHRVGGYNSHGKGSHYVGGRK